MQQQLIQSDILVAMRTVRTLEGSVLVVPMIGIMRALDLSLLVVLTAEKVLCCTIGCVLFEANVVSCVPASTALVPIAQFDSKDESVVT